MTPWYLRELEAKWYRRLFWFWIAVACAIGALAGWSL